MEEIGACIADPFANGEGAEEKRYVHHAKKGAGGGCIDPGPNLKHGRGLCQATEPQCPSRVRTDKTQSEHNESGLPPKADIRADMDLRRFCHKRP